MKLRLFAICYIVLAVGGCARLPHAFETIQVGHPLDRSILPQHVLAMWDSDNKHRIHLMEKQQLLLPLGMIHRELTIQLDANGTATKLLLDEYTTTYWFLLMFTDGRTRMRALYEKAEDDRFPPHLADVQGNPYFFLLTVIGFLGPEACEFEKQVAQAATQPTTGFAGTSSAQRSLVLQRSRGSATTTTKPQISQEATSQR